MLRPRQAMCQSARQGRPRLTAVVSAPAGMTVHRTCPYFGINVHMYRCAARLDGIVSPRSNCHYVRGARRSASPSRRLRRTWPPQACVMVGHTRRYKGTLSPEARRAAPRELTVFAPIAAPVAIFWSRHMDLTAQRQMTALVVEEDASIRSLLADLLESGGYGRVETATSAQAPRLAEEHGPDVIVIDLDPACPRSLGTLGELGTRPATRNVPVIVLSVDATAGGGAGRGNLGEVVQMPFDIADLLLRVDRAARSI